MILRFTPCMRLDARCKEDRRILPQSKRGVQRPAQKVGRMTMNPRELARHLRAGVGQCATRMAHTGGINLIVLAAGFATRLYPLTLTRPSRCCLSRTRIGRTASR